MKSLMGGRLFFCDRGEHSPPIVRGSGTSRLNLDLESAPANSQSIVDRLLENAIRMTSVDAYRLATVLDAHASCAKALQFRSS